jgi:hypothetical protein
VQPHSDTIKVKTRDFRRKIAQLASMNEWK